MEMSVFELLGVAGIAISMLAYVPQVVHLGREHCSAGISRRAWAMWLGSSVLIGATAHEAGLASPGASASERCHSLDEIQAA